MSILCDILVWLAIIAGAAFILLFLWGLAGGTPGK